MIVSLINDVMGYQILIIILIDWLEQIQVNVTSHRTIWGW